MFKKFLPLLFLFAGFQANAALFQFQFEDTISYSSIPGLPVGLSATITLGLDNGGTSLLSQTWTSSDLTAVTFDFGGGGYVTTFFGPFDGGLVYTAGQFLTDPSGSPSSVMTDWSDLGVFADFTVSGGSHTSFNWYLDGADPFFVADPGVAAEAGVLHLAGNDWFSRASRIMDPGQWTLVAVVPEPSIIALFGLGLAGLGFARRKRQS